MSSGAANSPRVLAALAVVLNLAACGGSDGFEPTGSPTSLRFVRDTATLGIEGTVTLTPRESAGRAISAEALRWTSSNPEVAHVSSAGLVTGIGAGAAEIRAGVGDLADTAYVTVLPFISLGAAIPQDINTAGTVAGSIEGQPFVWSRAAGVRRLPVLTGTRGAALALADDGTTVGISGEDFTTARPVVWTFSPEGSVVSETLPWDGGPTGAAHGVAAAGDRIVGQVFTRTEPDRYNPYPAVWSRSAGGTWNIEILPVPAEGFGAAFKINAAGHVLGLVEVDGPAGFTTSAVVWSQAPDLTWAYETVATGELGTVSATGINAAGSVVGMQDDRAVLWTRTGSGWIAQDLSDLGGNEFSFASDINDGGVVVGASDDPQGRQRAFVWTSLEGMRDLGSLSLNASAVAINEAGVIAGLSYNPQSATGQLGTLWPAP
jgi:probable HAF family extracellular repeat protein